MIKVAVRLFSQNEKNHLEMVMHHASGRCGVECVAAAVPESDLVVISPSDPSFESIIRAWQSRRRGPMPVIYESNLYDQLVYQSLNLTPNEIPYLAKPATTEGLSRLIASVTEPTESATSAPLEVPADSLAAQLTAARDNRVLIELRSKDNRPIFVDGLQRKVTLDSGAMNREMLSISMRQALDKGADFSVRHIKAKRLNEKRLQPENRTIGLDHFLWLVGYQSVSSEPANDDMLGLSAWPDFGRIPYQAADITLAAQLVMQPLAFGQLKSVGLVDASSLTRFLSAARMSGLLTDGSMRCCPESPSFEVKQTVNRGLIKRLLGRLFSLPAG